MGTAVDRYGPRYGICCCLGLTCPAVFLIALAQTPAQFLAARLVSAAASSAVRTCTLLTALHMHITDGTAHY
jgi:MFS family permease